MKLELSGIRKKLPFTVNRGLSVFRIKDVVNSGQRSIDFDVFLPSIGKNLQRELVWTLLQKQELIMSILKDIKLPTMAFIETDEKAYQIIDGKQRLSAWIGFVKGEFPIECDGKEFFYDDLDKGCQFEISMKYIVADVAYSDEDKPISDEYKIQWFKLINFSGTPQDKSHMDFLEETPRL